MATIHLVRKRKEKKKEKKPVPKACDVTRCADTQKNARRNRVVKSVQAEKQRCKPRNHKLFRGFRLHKIKKRKRRKIKCTRSPH